MYELNNNLDLKGAQLKDWRGDMLSASDITAIESGVSGGTITKASQESRKVYNTTTHQFMNFDYITGKFKVEGGGEGADNYRGYLDCTITTETDTIKKNPPALSNCKGGDVWVVRTSGTYTYIDKNGSTQTVKADVGDIFRVIIASPATETTDEVLDWMYQENQSSQLELVIEYNSTDPTVKHWEFSQSGSGAFLKNIWKKGYLCQCYKETTVADITTRVPTLDKVSIVIDESGTETAYKAVIDFARPLVDGEKYIFVIA